MSCSSRRHALIRLRMFGGEIIGIQKDGDVERLELVNCEHCHTTIGRPCADAKHLDVHGHTMCGVPDEGAFLVEESRHVDCPLCRLSIERAAVVN